jgi:heme d1 biosynthesis radical SAM protein NirJ
MFRLSQYLRAITVGNNGHRPKPPDTPTGPVVIWNLLRRCNLTCKHCYATSADIDFAGELTTAEIFSVMDELSEFHVPVLILSGGEPMLHPDILEIAARAKNKGFYVGLSSNGTLIDNTNIERLVELNLDYVGVSIDGMRPTHDKFRRRDGAFDEAIRSIQLCQSHGIRIGLRFTLTQDNHRDLPQLLDLMRELDIDKFYLSHLNYAGRGNKNRTDDAQHNITRDAVTLLIEHCLEDINAKRKTEFVTGNNDADGVFLYQWVLQNMPEKSPQMKRILERWGGNSSGINIANIDNLGNVHPDTMWWDYTLGNVRERPFADIWKDTSDPLMHGLKQHPRPLKGRCALCTHQKICGGNSRTRAWQLTGDPWTEDPGCYLTDEEIGVSGLPPRIPVTPRRRGTHPQIKVNVV